MKWPEKLTRMRPYETETGTFPIRLDANESFLSPPDWLRDKVENAWASVAWNRYPDANAIDLRETASQLFGVPAAQIVPGNGSDELIGLIMATFVPSGGRVLISQPDFSMYRFYADLYDQNCTPIGKNDRQTDIDALIEAYDRTPSDLILFSNPCNPTGLGVRREDILHLLRHVDCPVVVDEAYMDFWDQSVLSEIGTFEHLIVLKTCSKAFGMAAFRLGFALASPRVAETLRMTKSPFNVNALTQSAGVTVLSEPSFLRESVETIRAQVMELHSFLCEALVPYSDRVEVMSTETNFVLLKTVWAGSLFDNLKSYGILVRQLGVDYLRITAGNASENRAVVDALVKSTALCERDRGV